MKLDFKNWFRNWGLKLDFETASELYLKLDFETGYETGFETGIETDIETVRVDLVVSVVERSKRNNGSKRSPRNDDEMDVSNRKTARG